MKQSTFPTLAVLLLVSLPAACRRSDDIGASLDGTKARARLTGELHHTRAELETTRAQLAAADEEIETLRADIVAAQAERDRLFEKLVEAEDGRHETARQLMRLQEQVAQLLAKEAPVQNNTARSVSVRVIGFGENQRITRFPEEFGIDPMIRYVNRYLVELSIGSDDGLRVGHAIALFRLDGRRSWGRVTRVTPTRAVVDLQSHEIYMIGDEIELQSIEPANRLPAFAD